EVRFCSVCGWRSTDPDAFTIKRAEYRKPGHKGRSFKTRTVAHLCATCLNADPDFNLEPLRPFQSAALARMVHAPDIDEDATPTQRGSAYEIFAARRDAQREAQARPTPTPEQRAERAARAERWAAHQREQQAIDEADAALGL